MVRFMARVKKANWFRKYVHRFLRRRRARFLVIVFDFIGLMLLLLSLIGIWVRAIEIMGFSLLLMGCLVSFYRYYKKW